MILKVTVHDNDFGIPLRRACEDLLHNITEGNPGGLDKLLADLEGARNSLVIGTYGHLVAGRARHYRITRRLIWLDNPSKEKSIEKFLEESTGYSLTYINKNMIVKVLESLDNEPDWGNGEVVYIDFDCGSISER